MANTTKAEAIRLVTKALEEGHTLHIYDYGNDLTAGPYCKAVQPAYEKFAAFNYTRRRQEETYANRASDVAHWVVERVGRGSAGRAARKALLKEVA